MANKIVIGYEPTTFLVDDVTPATNPIWTESLMKSLSRRLKRKIVALPDPALPVINEHYDSIREETGSNLDPDEVGSRCHSLIEAVQIAFSQHRPLVLSPDCLWLVIAEGFGHHVREHAEAFRGRLVRHQGKLDLREYIYGESPKDFEYGVAGLSEQIRRESDPVVHETLICDFSTTTTESRIASQVALMDTYSSYFKYELFCVCGIPRITVTGTVADWQKMRDRIEVLATFELEWWVARLRPILDQFIQTVKGHPTDEFWQAIYKPRKAYNTTLVTGWITDLFPYLGDPPRRKRNHVFKWQREDWVPRLSVIQHNSDIGGVPTWAFPSGLCSVPFNLEFRDKPTRQLELVAGFFGISQSPEDFALSPLIGWCVTEPYAQRVVSLGYSAAETRWSSRVERQRHRWHDWFSGMPCCLRPLLEDQARLIGTVITAPSDVENRTSHLGTMANLDEALWVRLKETLEDGYPDPAERARALFQWLGSGVGLWTRYPAYEEVAEDLLMEVPIADILRALRDPWLPRPFLEGAARFLAGWKYATKHDASQLKLISAELRLKLLEVGMDTINEDRKARAKAAFGS
jgi:hypothetical protein